TLKEDGSLHDSYVLYNAGEPEIGALVVFADGTIYAGTADADQARPGRLNEAVGTEVGRPELQGPKAAPTPKIPNTPPAPSPSGTKPSAPAPGNSARPAPAGGGAAPAPGNANTPAPAAPKAAPVPAPGNKASDNSEDGDDDDGP